MLTCSAFVESEKIPNLFSTWGKLVLCELDKQGYIN